MPEPKPLLLDTHYWIWMELGDRGRISRRAAKAIENAASEGALLVSAISVWELGMLEAKGRIRLRIPCETWVERALSTPGLALAPLTVEIALDSTRLPGLFHGDPTDRILVATARRLGARLLTRDPKLIQYGRQHHVSLA